MEKKSKSIILGVVIVLLIVIIGLVISFASGSIIDGDSNNTVNGPQDHTENIPFNTISTPSDSDGANTLNYILTE